MSSPASSAREAESLRSSSSSHSVGRRGCCGTCTCGSACLPSGIWYRLGQTELHIQCRDDAGPVDSDYHPALVVDDLGALKERLRANGVEVIDAPALLGRERCFCRDPFGNRIELMELPS